MFGSQTFGFSHVRHLQSGEGEIWTTVPMEQTQLAPKVLDLNKVVKFVLRRSVFWHRNGIFKIMIQKQRRTNVSLSGFRTRGRSVGPKFQTSLQKLPNVDYCNNVTDRCRNASQHTQVPIPCQLFSAFFPVSCVLFPRIAFQFRLQS
jgi:hypothetical protein